jgi:hypothetical protein
MIHAWNFIREISEENGGHGQNFLAKMHEINREGKSADFQLNFHSLPSFRPQLEPTSASTTPSATKLISTKPTGGVATVPARTADLSTAS